VIDPQVRAAAGAAMPSLSPAEIERLKTRARTGDREALQILRDSGYFERKAAERKGFAASHAQKRLWVIDRMVEGGSAAYNIPVALLLEGPLDVEALRRALGAVVERHESLRTALKDVDGEPRQFIAAGAGFDVAVVDLRDQSDPEARAAGLVARAADQPFDLTRAPLLRASILRLAADRHVLALTAHHIVFDQSSSGVFVRELSQAYRAFRNGRPLDLPALTIQYKDFAAWQNVRLSGPEAEPHRQYWLQKFAGGVVPLEIPADRPRPSALTFRGGIVSRLLDVDAFRGLEKLAQGEGATMLMALAAAVKMLLYRYTGQQDIVIGTTTAGRERQELEDQIGFYVNSLALRDTVRGGESFRTLLGRLRATATEAYEHQTFPFDRLVDELNLGRDLSRSPLFDVMLSVDDEPAQPLVLDELRVSPFGGGQAAAKYDLTLDFGRAGAAWTLRVIYNEDLYTHRRIERLVSHLERITAAAVRVPDRPIRLLGLLGEDEAETLMTWSHGERQPDVSPASVIDLFEAQVARTPNAEAVRAVSADRPARSTSYRELNTIAAAIAAQLRQQPVGDGAVGVLVGREHLVEAVLAAMKSGAAYLPLEPALPADRLKFLVQDSRAVTLLTDRAHAELASTLGVDHVVRVDAGIEPALPDPPPLVESRRTDAPAYVIYTSGSTGAPKGVEVEHAGFTNMVASQVAAFGVAPSDVVLQFASCSFDASLSEMFMALVGGGCLLCADERMLKDPAELLGLMRREHVTIATLPPPYIRALGFDALAGLKTVITAGEEAEHDRGRLAAAGCHYFNAYGPTEFSVCATIGDVGGDSERDARVPLGRPIANTEILVLEPDGFGLRPIGVPGEICLAGAGVARGYRGRADLTGERFVPHPWSRGARMYRTGDRGRWREDGTVEFIGRIDRQLKIRGYRIEPGEIESVLKAQPGVQDAVIVDRGGTLIAYVEAGEGVTVQRLDDALSRSLPEYMVPSHLVVVPELPRAASGKVQRDALPSPEADRAIERASPRTHVERVLAAIWEEILGLASVGIHERFLDLGGNSMKAILMVSRVLRDLQARLPIRYVFEQGTIASLASVIERQPEPDGIPVVPAADHYEVSHGQRRLWTIDKMLDGAGVYNVGGAMRLAGACEAARLRTALEAIAARHESLRTTFVEIDGGPRQVVHGRLPLDFDVLEMPGDDGPVREWIERDVARPFDLTRGPLFRSRLFRTGPESSVFYLNVHHLVCDGWSLEVFFRDLLRFHDAPPGTREDPLPIQYKDFAAWQNARLAGRRGDADRAFWQQLLSGELPLLDLPTDRPRSSVKAFRGSTLTFTIDAGLSQRMRDLAGRLQVTSVTLWLALVYTLVHRYTRAEDIIVGVPAALREHPALEDQIGFFVNMIPLRLRMDGAEPCARLLERVRSALHESFEHKDYPYDRLVEELDLRRDASRNPLFDMAVSVQETGRREPGSRTAGLSSFPFTGRTSKFDLTMFAGETGAGEWEVVLEYDTALFDAPRIERMARHLRTLLCSMTESPQSAVGDLELLDAPERAEVCERWNKTARPYPRDESLGELFRAVARRSPDDLAIVCRDRALTYAELDRASDRLAATLRQAATDLRIVPVLLDRSVSAPLAFLAVLKAGAAYAPIDTSFPPPRIAALLSALKATTVLSDRRHIAGARSGSPGIHFIDVDSPECDSGPPGRSGTGGDLAYVMYTSGSTGTPKGVLIEHRSVARLVLGTDYVSIGRGDRILHVSSLGFDASTFEIWGALINGATLCIPPADEVPDGPQVRAWIRRFAPSIMWLTASLFNQLAEFDASMFAGVRTLLTGGERLSPPHVNLVRDACPATTIVNGYGPTENTTFSVCHRIDARYQNDIPLGRPIANSRAYVVDPNLRPLPVGVPGELLVAGDGVARGYLDDEALTRSRFVPDPFVEGGRAYRTGDRAAWRADGTLEFLGRFDQQVKVRGYRVEPGEVEIALRAAGAAESAVVARTAGTGTQELIAYVVTESGVDANAIRDRLRAAVPAYMVPAQVVAVERMPLTSNGKLDRRRLPDPDRHRPSPGPQVASTDREATLSRIWAEVLGRTEPGPDDNYFELGGDSIQAIQIVSRLRRDGWLLGVRDLFQQPTIRALASVLRRAPTDHADQQQTTPDRTHGPLSPIQRWFFDRGGADRHFNQSVLLRAKGTVSERWLGDAVRALGDEHAALRTRFSGVSDGGIQQWVSGLGGSELETVDLAGSTDLARAIYDHTSQVQCSLDLVSGPVMRAVLYRAVDGDRLFLCIHHLAVDAVSWRILLEDLETAYRKAAQGESPALGHRTASYVEWTHALHDKLRTGAFEQERAYWAAIDAARVVPLPYDLEDADPGTFGEADTLTLAFDAPTTRRLLEATFRAYGARVDELLLTAVGRTMAAFVGYPRVVVAVESHGRQSDWLGLDVSRTVGWFTALHPLLVDLSGDSIGEDVKRVKEALRRVPRGGVGYGLLGDVAAKPGHAVAPAIGFNYLGQFDTRPSTDAVFSATDDARGPDIAGRVPRSHHLDVSGAVAGGRLQLTFTYCPRRFERRTIERLGDALRAEAVAVIEHCAARLVKEKTPSDFTSSDLSLDDYAHLLQQAGIRGEDVDDVAYLSPMQEGLLYQHRLNSGSAAYHVQMDFGLGGALDVERYRLALVELARRHAVLRTAFFHEGLPRPVQVVLRDAPFEFAVRDLSQLPEVTRARSPLEYRRQDLARGFDMRRAPLWRIAVFKEAPDRYRVIWSWHHILIDGWSLGILSRQLSEIYQAIVRGETPARGPERPFAAFIQWLEQMDAGRAREYWRKYLAGIERRTTVPRRSTPSGREYAFAERTFEAGERRTEALHRAAAQLGVSPYSVLQAAWTIVLSRYSGTSEVVFGSVVSGRPPSLPHVEEVVGLFINTVPVRVGLKQGQTFAELVRDVQRLSLDQSEFQYLPLAEIQRLAPVGPDLFDHLLVYENYPLVRDAADDGDHGAPLAAESLDAHDESHYDLNVVFVPGRRLQVRLSFNTNVHPSDWVERFVDHLFAALDAGCLDLHRPVEAIDAVPPAEHQRVLTRFQGPRRAGSRPLPSVIDVVRAHARRSGDAPAVVFHGTAMSYAALDDQSDRLAAWLSDCRGVGRDVRVGVLMDRSPRLMVSLLAVLKAGGAYVPIDPSYPADRVAFVLSDCAAAAVLTDRAHATAVDAGRAVDVDALWPEVVATPPHAATSPAPDSLAYVIYTSGSTGKPKGCQIEHRNLSHYLEWASRAYFGDSSGGAFALYSSLSFDLTVTSLFLPLMRGRPLHVLPQDLEVHDALRAMLEEASGLDAIKMTPSHISLVPELGLRRTGVSTAIVGGEALRDEHVRILRALNPEMVIFNEYGPTETTVGCIVKRVGHGDDLMTIGRPIDQTRVYIVGRDGRVAPIGVPGEIWIGGDGVGRGYLGLADLTRERFTPDPFAADVSPAVCYRTGDVGRWLPDGEIEYLGRSDDQIKIRGHRIEPAEIEAAINRVDPHAGEAIVVPRVTEPGSDPILVAYVTGRPDLATLRDRLANVIPEPFIPAHFVVLERLPLTPNGKVDRSALPDPVRDVSAGSSRGRSPIEQAVADIWKDVLGLERVGRDDKFFALGGHSLKAAQIVSRVLRRLGVKVSLREFFQDGTVAVLAARIASRAGQDAVETIPAVAHAPDYALSSAQHRLWLLHQMPGGETAYNIPYGLEIEGDGLDTAALQAAIAAVVARHEALRTAFVLAGGEPRQSIVAVADLPPVPLEVVDLREMTASAAEERAAAAAEELARQPFDLARPPLMRVAVLQMPAATRPRTLLLIVVHHIVGDGWSMTVLMRELTALYQARRAGDSRSLPPLPLQYKDYAEWERGKDWSGLEAWWVERLAGTPERILLPYDARPPAERDFRGDTVETILELPTAEALRALGAAHGATLAHVLLGLFQLSLYKLSGQRDLCIGMSFANRNRKELENLIGFFVNLVPIRIVLSDDMELEELIGRLAKDVTDALDHDCPFDRLVRRLNPERVANRQPLLNVVYAFHRFDDLRLDVGSGVMPGPAREDADTVRSYPIRFRTSKFDLTLFVIDEGDGRQVRLLLEYDTALFSSAGATRVVDAVVRFAHLAVGVASEVRR
jgi:amino acid adenylation domain-containing protein/non-ribosomal peptide synthase protein (TIGR01720 family)